MYNNYAVASDTIEAASTEFPENAYLLSMEFFFHSGAALAIQVSLMLKICIIYRKKM